MLVSGRPELFQAPVFKGAGEALKPRPGFRSWTDDYSNLFRVLK